MNATRFAAGLLLAAMCQGCSSESPQRSPEAALRHTATVSIDGRDTGERYYVACRKLQWSSIMETTGSGAGFSAAIEEAAALDAQFVKIRQLGGFTGSAWRGGVGEVSARRESGAVTIRGTGYGYFADRADRVTTASFTITTFC